MALEDYSERDLLKPYHKGGLVLTETAMNELLNLFQNDFDEFDLNDFEREFIEDYERKFNRYYSADKNNTIYCSIKQLNILIKIERKIEAEK